MVRAYGSGLTSTWCSGWLSSSLPWSFGDGPGIAPFLRDRSHAPEGRRCIKAPLLALVVVTTSSSHRRESCHNVCIARLDRDRPLQFANGAVSSGNTDTSTEATRPGKPNRPENGTGTTQRPSTRPIVCPRCIVDEWCGFQFHAGVVFSFLI